MYSLLILLFMIFIPIPIMMKFMLTGKSAYRGVLEGIISSMIGVTMIFLFFRVMTGVTVFEMLDSMLSNISIEDMNLPESYGMLGLKDLDPEQMQLAMNNIKEVMKISIPGTIIIAVSIFAYINYTLVSWLLRKSGKEVCVLPPFKNFSLPKSVMLGSILIFLLSYLASNMGIIDKGLIMYNIQMLFTFIFSIQGLAVMFYYGNLKKVPKLIIVIMAALFIFTWIGQTVLFIIGLIDIALDMRKRFSQTNLK